MSILARFKALFQSWLRPAAPTEPAQDSLVSLDNSLANLEQAQTETEQVLQKLESDVTRLREQAQTAEEQAQQVLPDEDRAREYLATRQDIQDRDCGSGGTDRRTAGQSGPD